MSLTRDSSGQAVEVSSRWWYWIAAYPIAIFAALPILILAAVFAVTPFVIIDVNPVRATAWLAILGVLFLVGLIIGLLILVLTIFLMLPIALYFDAKEVVAADVEWDPDPILYTLIAALQFFVTPLIGVIVGTYYLYRRHDAIGVP